MAVNNDHQTVLAAEYALGTLDSAERIRVETLAQIEPRYRSAVRGWERQFGALNHLVGLVEPAPTVWERIQARTRTAGEPEQEPPKQALELSPVTGVTALTEPASKVAPVIAPEPDPRQKEGKALPWRIATAILLALSAALAGLAYGQIHAPEHLPPYLRAQPAALGMVPSPVAMEPTAEASASRPAGLIALMQATLPDSAFVLQFDPSKRVLTMLRLIAAPEADKVHKLWMILDDPDTAEEVGVLAATERSSTFDLSAYDAAQLRAATYFISQELATAASEEATAAPDALFWGKLVDLSPDADNTSAIPSVANPPSDAGRRTVGSDTVEPEKQQ